MRLIDADKIVYSWQIDADGQEHDGVTLQSIISKMPTIEERKKGKWIPCKASIHPYGNDVKCSECGHKMGSSFGYKFCPMCGAKMEGVQP